jgi:hypothetical protein
MKRIRTLLQSFGNWRHRYTVTFVAIAVTVILSLKTVYTSMQSQQTWFTSVKTDITFNFVLLFFFYGILCDRLTKKMSRRKGWIVWAVGMALLMLFFRFVGGYSTNLG